MKDRVPTQPGRVKITPEDVSQPFYYATIEIADNPAESGTPLNKATLLNDEVCGILGIDPDSSTPSDAFARLKNITNQPTDIVVGMFTISNQAHAYRFAEIDLGFEPEMVLVYSKDNNRLGLAVGNTYSAMGSWSVLVLTRLYKNAETGPSGLKYSYITPTGFYCGGETLTSTGTFFYVAFTTIGRV